LYNHWLIVSSGLITQIKAFDGNKKSYVLSRTPTF